MSRIPGFRCAASRLHTADVRMVIAESGLKLSAIRVGAIFDASFVALTSYGSLGNAHYSEENSSRPGNDTKIQATARVKEESTGSRASKSRDARAALIPGLPYYNIVEEWHWRNAD